MKLGGGVFGKAATFGALSLLVSAACGKATAPARDASNPAPDPSRDAKASTAGGMAPQHPGRTVPEGESPARASPAAPDDLTPLGTELRAGEVALGEDRLDAAARYFEQAVRLNPSHPAAKLGVVRARWAKLGLPTAYAESPHHPELEALVALLDTILTEHRDYPPALRERGRLSLVLGDAPKALQSLTRAVALAPDDAESRSALGIAHLATGKPELALHELEISVKLAPHEPERLTNLGTAYMLRGRLSEAIATYERALALRPDDARTHGDLGAAHLANDRVDKALPHLLRATTLAPQRATFLTNLGYAYQRQGQLDKAVETQRQALAIDPKLGSAWINLGNALAELRQYEQAEVALRQAETLDPTDPRPKASLRDLAEARARETERRDAAKPGTD